MKEYQKYFDIPFGGFCGVFVTEKLMKRICKIEYRFIQELKSVLTNNLDECEIAHWTGVQVEKDENLPDYGFITCHYIDNENSREDKLQRIELIKNILQVIATKRLYRVDGKYSTSHDAAQKELAADLEAEGYVVKENKGY